MKGGFAIKTMPENTKTTLRASAGEMGSLMNSLAKMAVNMGELAPIIVASANGKC